MSFLQPYIFAALPLIALPIVIHLINRRRHRSVEWAAMMFLVSAKKMNTGMARLRHFMILLLRVLAMAALLFAVSRPLASGFLSGFGSAKIDTTLVLLDRSASMETMELQSGLSKRATGLAKLSELLDKRGFGQELVLFDSALPSPSKVERPRDLLQLAQAEATATSANIPDLFERAINYLRSNEVGRADVWLCSDLRLNDWNTDSGRWKSIHDQLANMKGVQTFLLSYPQAADDNLAIRVENLRRRVKADGAELSLDILISQSTAKDDQASATVRQAPVEIEINGAKTSFDVELDAAGAAVRGYRVPIDRRLESGWGSVSIPNDSNALDNRFYFVFSSSDKRQTTVVSDVAEVADAFKLSLGIPREPGITNEVTSLTPSQTNEIDWQATSLLIWQSAIPTGTVARQIRQFVDSGRTIVFFPPVEESASTTSSEASDYLAAAWGNWRTMTETPRKLSWWNGASDLLANVGSGAPLPLNDTRIYRHRELNLTNAAGEPLSVTPLAKSEQDGPLLLHVPTDNGNVYFCTTLPTIRYSTLQQDAVSFYVMLQRALEVGAQGASPVAIRDVAPNSLAIDQNWEPIANDSNTNSLNRGMRAGVFRAGENWLALNRSAQEDNSAVAAPKVIDALFDGLSFERIEDTAGDSSSLVNEVWRAFLIAMLLALAGEALLCLPDPPTKENATANVFATGSTEAPS